MRHITRTVSRRADMGSRMSEIEGSGVRIVWQFGRAGQISKQEEKENFIVITSSQYICDVESFTRVLTSLSSLRVKSESATRMVRHHDILLIFGLKCIHLKQCFLVRYMTDVAR